MPSCKKTKKFTDKDGNAFNLECVEGEGHEGKHQASVKYVETSFFQNIFFD